MSIKSTLSTIFFIVILFVVEYATAQDNLRTRVLNDFASETVNYLEGFSQITGENDFEYHSLRNDLSKAMLTRATTGIMAIEWNTAPVNVDLANDGAGFVWIAAIDITPEAHNFDVYIDGTKRFVITSGTKETFAHKTPDGGSLKFVTSEIDQHGDAHGYMALWAPASWLNAGKPLNIKIVGAADNSNTWMIIYQAQDAQDYLQQSLKFNSWAIISVKTDNANTSFDLSLPAGLNGNDLLLNIDGKRYTLPAKLSGDNAQASLTVNRIPKNKNLSLSDKYGEIINVNDYTVPGKTTKLTNKALLQNQISNTNGTIQISGVRTYKPNTVASLKKISTSNLSKGNIYLMNSSHQDIAWMDSPEKCILERDTMLLTPLFNKLKTNPDYRFDIEDALMLKEYIHRHPDRKNEIRGYLEAGNISCGSSYTQPYEEIFSGEALVRQFYFGTCWLKKEFGYSANTYWNMDVPSRTLQMPQILKKSGTDFLAISRHEKGVYDWYSPDGSYVTTYSPGHYGYDFTPLQKNFYEAAEHIAGATYSWNNYYKPGDKQTVTPVFSDWDMSPGKDYSSLMKQWNNISEIQGESGKYQSIQLPKIKYALIPEFISHFKQSASDIAKIQGERPAVWLYIHGPTHQQAILASRQADILLTAAEKFCTANALVDKDFTGYPTQQLNDAWEARIYPDHGWGGKHGDITDALFKEKYYFARHSAENILSTAQSEISSKIMTDDSKGIPLIVFNSLSWERTDFIKATLNFNRSEIRDFCCFDASGTIIPFQEIAKENYEDGSIKQITISFVAEKIPSIGYKTYYINNGKCNNSEKLFQPGNNYFENQYYKILFTDGGLASIFDKQLDRELLDTKKFKGCEIFTMHSEGTGAGEFSDIQQPDMKGFDKASNYKSTWKISSNGSIYTEYNNRQPIRDAVIEQKIKIFHQVKKILVEVDLLNYQGILYREYRMALPLNITDGQVSYEVPFGVVNIGKDELEGAAGERYKTPCKDIHPRGIGNWIGASNQNYGVTLSSSVAVADYIDPTTNPVENTVLQPILLTSRRSCHGEGNEYLQTGDHSFLFSITSHVQGWENGYKSALTTNDPLRVVFRPKKYLKSSLPEDKSFFSVNDDNILISTVKKAEDDDAAVLRLYNITGKDTITKIQGINKFTYATKANLIEEIQDPISIDNGAINTSIGKFSIETFLLK